MSKKYNWNDVKYVKVPDVVGMDLSDAKKKLKGFNVETSGEGNKVILVSPSVGTSVKENSTIMLYLN